MAKAFRRRAERRNKMVRWPLSPTEKSAKLTPFRVIAPLYEKLTAYLAKKWTFATPGPTSVSEMAFHKELERLKTEHNGGKSFPKRDEDLKGGRPIR